MTTPAHVTEATWARIRAELEAIARREERRQMEKEKAQATNGR